MSETLVTSAAAIALADAHTALDVLTSVELGMDTAEELLAGWRELERLRNRIASIEHGFVADAERRGLPYELGARNTPAMLRNLLRLDPRDAAGRVHAADAAAARTSLTGETVPAPYPLVAAAQAAGAISARHARVIVNAVHKLPDEVQAAEGGQIEAQLVELAGQFDPSALGTLALRIRAHHDPDGILTDLDYRARHRELNITPRPDGSAAIHGEATAELTERLLTVLDPLAQPRPADDGVRDPRTGGQRRHDALLDALELVQRAELLPTTAGISATILLTMTTQAWHTATGTAVTGHGALIPAAEAIRWAGGQARIISIARCDTGAILAHTDTRRLFTENQRLAMAARDRGCTFPGCDAPIAWTQAHHITDHAHGGPTTINNGALICGHDHRERIRQGWTSILLHGRPAWVPPPWIDPDQIPRINTMHHAG